MSEFEPCLVHTISEEGKMDDTEVELAKEGTIMAEFQRERTDAISEMFDGVDGLGIYPTGRFFVRLDKAVEKALFQLLCVVSIAELPRFLVSSDSLLRKIARCKLDEILGV